MIFSKQYPRMPGENQNHYICKSYLGQMIGKFYGCEINYEFEELPIISTQHGDRKYQPDIWISDINHKKKEIYLCDAEISGGIHFKNKTQYNKNKLRREAITNYFNNYSDMTYPDYEVIFSYLVFLPDDFLYNKIDYFFEIFERYFSNGGVFPSTDLYEEIFL